MFTFKPNELWREFIGKVSIEGQSDAVLATPETPVTPVLDIGRIIAPGEAPHTQVQPVEIKEGPGTSKDDPLHSELTRGEVATNPLYVTSVDAGIIVPNYILQVSFGIDTSTGEPAWESVVNAASQNGDILYFQHATAQIDRGVIPRFGNNPLGTGTRWGFFLGRQQVYHPAWWDPGNITTGTRYRDFGTPWTNESQSIWDTMTRPNVMGFPYQASGPTGIKLCAYLDQSTALNTTVYLTIPTHRPASSKRK